MASRRELFSQPIRAAEPLSRTLGGDKFLSHYIAEWLLMADPREPTGKCQAQQLTETHKDLK